MSEGPADAGFTLPGRCGAGAAHDLAAAGRGLAPGARLRIEAGAVERMSCAAAIAVISLARSAAATGGAVIVGAPSRAFTDAFADLGLYAALMAMEFAE